MGLYSIKDLSQLTSIKTHTIRMWEKRYGILKPKRTESNNRYYCEPEVTLLGNIALLNHEGFKISKLAAMTDQELNTLADKFRSSKDEETSTMDSMTTAIMQFDEVYITDSINASLKEKGVHETMLHLLFPVSARLNLLSLTGHIQQIHLGHYFNLIKNIFVSETGRMEHKVLPDAPHLVIFPYSSSKQFVSVALLNYCLKVNGIRCTELGLDTPPEELQIAYTNLKPSAFITIVNEQMAKQKFLKLINDLVSYIGNTPLYIIGTENGESSIKFPASVKFFPDIKNLVLFAQSMFHTETV